MGNRLLPLRGNLFGDAKALEGPLNELLWDLQRRLSLLEGYAQTLVLPPCDVAVPTGAYPTAGTTPFPIYLGLPDGFSAAGLVVLCVANIDDPNTTGINVDAVALCAWKQENNTLRIDYMTGLPEGRVRLIFGAVRANAIVT